MYENCLKQSNDSFRYSNLNFRVVIMHVLMNLRDNRSWAAKMSLKLAEAKVFLEKYFRSKIYFREETKQS